MPPHSKTKRVCYHGPTNTFTVATPIGEITIVSCPRGLHRISQSPDISDKDFKPDPSCKVELTGQLYLDNGYTYTPALHCIQWLKDYFSRVHCDKIPSFCPSSLSSGSFTTKVWLTLMDVAPFGSSVSYKSLSAASGNANAARAVGQAMANNPFMLIVPCHRVICSDGSCGSFTTNVWLTLMEVAPFGSSVSYKKLSAAAGNANAARAVGQAMANNPFTLIVPCHRVICSDGSSGNYGHGKRNSVKSWLLKFENGDL